MDYVLWLIASYSLTFAFIESPMLKPIRNIVLKLPAHFHHLTKCYHCAGFWASMFLFNFCFESTNLIQDMLIASLFGAGVILIVQYLMMFLLTSNKLKNIQYEELTHKINKEKITEN